LDRIDLTLDLIRDTAIGKKVNKMRKVNHQEVKTLSANMVDKWHSLVNAVKGQGQTATL
jgi:hypothetical protein